MAIFIEIKTPILKNICTRMIYCNIIGGGKKKKKKVTKNPRNNPNDLQQEKHWRNCGTTKLWNILIQL